jgi:hypothetical protein
VRQVAISAPVVLFFFVALSRESEKPGLATSYHNIERDRNPVSGVLLNVRVGLMREVPVDRKKPLRLDAAAKAYFDEDSGVSANTLKSAIKAGALDGFKIAGKPFTTFAAIDQWIERLRTAQRPQHPILAPPDDGDAVARAKAAIERLRVGVD